MTYDKKIVRIEPQVPHTELLVINKRKGWICMDETKEKTSASRDQRCKPLMKNTVSKPV